MAVFNLPQEPRVEARLSETSNVLIPKRFGEDLRNPRNGQRAIGRECQCSLGMLHSIQILLELAVPWSAIKVNRGLGGADILEIQGFCLSLVAEVHFPLPAIRTTFEGEPRRSCFWTFPSRLPRAEFNDPKG